MNFFPLLHTLIIFKFLGYVAHLDGYYTWQYRVQVLQELCASGQCSAIQSSAPVPYSDIITFEVNYGSCICNYECSRGYKQLAHFFLILRY